jgi:hypothetical protein
MKKITKARKAKIKSEMQRLYERMEELGMTAKRSSVSLDFVDPYNDYFTWFETSTIARMAKVAQEIVDNEPNVQNWYLMGLDALPDQVVFTVNDREGFGSGDLIVSLETNYIGFVVYDNDFNEIG